MNNKISLYIPAYNAENTIEKCIESVLSQTLKPSEIIVINDCSRDKTLSLIKKFDEIKIVNNNKNFGLAKSRNIALEVSKFDLIASIDSDVVCDKNWLEILHNTMISKKIDLIGGRLIEINVHNKINLWRSIYLKQNWGNQSFENPDFIFGANSLINKKTLKNFKITYDERLKTNGEDVNISRIFRKNNLKLYYEAKAKCFHLQTDDINSLSNRYWRYSFYGAGLKKLNFLKLIKLIIRQFKKFFIWSFDDLRKKKIFFVKINLIVSLSFMNLCIKKYISNEKK